MSAQGVALVTGASRGIGKAIAVHLAGAGFDVAIGARTLHEGEEREHSSTVAKSDTRALPGSLDSTRALIEQAGGNALPVYLDLLDRSALESAVATVSRGDGARRRAGEQRSLCGAGPHGPDPRHPRRAPRPSPGGERDGAGHPEPSSSSPRWSSGERGRDQPRLELGDHGPAGSRRPGWLGTRATACPKRPCTGWPGMLAARARRPGDPRLQPEPGFHRHRAHRHRHGRVRVRRQGRCPRRRRRRRRGRGS